MIGHAPNPEHRPGLAHCRVHGATPVQGAPRSEDLDALALRTALAYRAGGAKLYALSLRFGMDEGDVSRALNGHNATPRRILERLTQAERATYDLVRAEAERAARRAA
jgi:hypothetical protein